MKIEIQRREDGILVLRPRGDLDALGYVSLVESLEEAIGADQDEVVLDLSDVAYINSICVGYIVQFWREVVRGGGFFAIAGPRSEVRRLLEVGGVDRYINLYEDVESAIAGCLAGDSSKSVLDERGLLELIKNFARISLSRLLNVEVDTADVPAAPATWELVRLSGDVMGVVGISIDAASSATLAAHLLAEVPECQEVPAAMDHLRRVVIDTSLSGLEEVGYEFEVDPIERDVPADLPNAVALETRFGTVVLGVDLKKIQTKRLRAQKNRE